MPVAAGYAADMPLKAPPAVAATVFSWTGFYVGAEAGWGDNRSDSTRLVANGAFLAGTTDSVDRKGGLFGFDAGANYQFNNWLVVGIEGDFQWSAIQGTALEFGNTPGAIRAGDVTAEARDTDWIDTVTGRLGVAWDRWMIYGKGGGAWRKINQNGLNTTTTALGTLVSNSTVNSSTESGYVIGAGVEWAPSDQVSVKLEGDWYNFGNNLSTGGVCLAGAACGGPGAIIAPGETTTKSTIWEIKGGVNFHYNWLAAR